jgi:hypothetical protein
MRFSCLGSVWTFSLARVKKRDLAWATSSKTKEMNVTMLKISHPEKGLIHS